jgi:hypothetical protein
MTLYPTNVILGLVPRIQPLQAFSYSLNSTTAALRSSLLGPRDKPEDDDLY